MRMLRQMIWTFDNLAVLLVFFLGISLCLCVCVISLFPFACDWLLKLLISHIDRGLSHEKINSQSIGFMDISFRVYPWLSLCISMCVVLMIHMVYISKNKSFLSKPIPFCLNCTHKIIHDKNQVLVFRVDLLQPTHLKAEYLSLTLLNCILFLSFGTGQRNIRMGT